MDVYVFIGENHHTDDEIEIFSSLETAKDYLERWLDDYRSREYEIEKSYESNDPNDNFIIGYTIGESDYASIRRCKLDIPEED